MIRPSLEAATIPFLIEGPGGPLWFAQAVMRLVRVQAEGVAAFRIGNADGADAPPNQDNDLRRQPPALTHPLHDADLARIVEAWPTLPVPIRRAMLALAESSK
jgi:hypothetical protein